MNSLNPSLQNRVLCPQFVNLFCGPCLYSSIIQDLFWDMERRSEALSIQSGDVFQGSMIHRWCTKITQDMRQLLCCFYVSCLPSYDSVSYQLWFTFLSNCRKCGKESGARAYWAPVFNVFLLLNMQFPELRSTEV